jgi:heat shock protein HslJ
MRRVGVALLVVLIAMAACGRARVPRFEERHWQLTELDGQRVRRDGAERVPHLEFHRDGRVTGFGGCNRLAGTYEVDGNRLTLGPLAATKMACADVMDIESAFVEGLGQVQRWQIENGRLGLFGAGGPPLAVFVEAGPPR